MGIALPQLAPASEDRVSGALVVDGSLRFDSRKGQRLTRTPGSAGNRKTWTYSSWVKTIPGGSAASNHKNLFSVDSGSANDSERMHMFLGNASDKIQHDLHSSSPRVSSSVYRDVSGWYHVVVKFDTLQAAARDQIAWFINGEQVLNWDTENALTQNNDYGINGAFPHAIGSNLAAGPGQFWDGRMSQVYLIDGMALGPEYFGYTDPLTGVWRPKKFKAQGTTINDGTQWSSGGGSGLYGSSSWGPTFDGTPASSGSSITDSAYVTNNGTSTVTFSKPISGVLRFRACQGSNSASTGNARPFVTLSDGQEIRVDGANNAPSNHSFGYVSGITSVTITGTSSQGMNLLSLTVDGVLMKDSTTQNLAFGTNGFYLPMDGNSPIGEDKSGRGNNWTPVNFGGSLELDNPIVSGARPILNTINGGTSVAPGVFGSEVSKTYTVTVANPGSGNKYYLDGALSANPTLHRGGTYTFDYTTPGASHPFYLSSLLDGKHNSKAYSVEFDGTNDYLSLASSADFALGTNDWTIEYFAYPESTTQWQRHFYLVGSDANQPEGIYANSSGIAFGKAQVFGETQVTNPLNQWNHYALVHDSTSMRLYINGSLQISSSNNFTDENKSLNIGYSNSTYGGYFDGKISNFRVIKGTALYTSNFTPPQTTLTTTSQGATSSEVKLLCCQDSDATTAAVKPGNITANGGAAATQTHQPFLYNNVHGNFGVNTSTSNVTKITVPHLAADSLYYYCSQHPNMGNTTAMSVVTDETKADQYAWKNVLALANGISDISNSVNCATTTKTVTNDGVAAVTTNSEFYGSSLQFESANTDSLTIEHADMAMGTGDFCVEFWVYNKTDKSYNAFISTRETSNGTSAGWVIATDAGADLYVHSSGAMAGGYDGDLHLPLNKWTHIAYTRSGGTHRLFMNGIASATASTTARNYTEDKFVVGDNGYAKDEPINAEVQDVRVYKGVAKYTSNFVPAATNPDILPDSPAGVAVKSKLKKVTDGAVAFDGTGDEVNVPSHSDLAFGTGNFTIDCFAYFNSFDDTYPTVLSKLVGGDLSWIVRVKNDGKVVWYSKNGSGTNNESSTTPIGLRRWHHIAVVREGTGSNQLKVYVDGAVHLTMTDSNDYNDSNALCIGTQQAGGGNTINGFISNVRIVKGTALYSGNFAPPTAPLTNVTNTKLLCCQSNTSAIAAAVIPTGSITVGGNASATAFNPFNSDINAIRGQEGNYATLNPLSSSEKLQSKTLKDGNLELSGNMGGSSGYPTAFSNFTMNGSGKWYMEATPFNMTDTGGLYIGLCDNQMVNGGVTVANTYPGGPGGVAYGANGTIDDNGSTTFSSQPTYTGGDVISVAYDADNGKVYFAKNGVYINGANPVTGANPHDTGRTGDQYFVVGAYENRNVNVNFGQKPFKFPPPDGYQPLTSSTLRPDTVIAHPDKYFSTTLYVGNGASSPGGSGGTQSIDVGHKPDLIWIKDRTQNHDHNLIDTIRGVGSILMSNATTAPPITNSTDAVTAFTDTGFTLGDNGEGTQSLELNKNANNYVVWSWVAGGTPTATNDNTSGAMDANSVSVDGVLQSAYTPVGSPTIYPKKMSVGTKQGFSIVEYGGNSTSGAKVPHGLTQAPDFMVIKTTTLNGQGWGAYHQGIGATKYLQLNTKDHQSNDYAGFLNNTAPTNQVFTLGNDNFVNTGHTYMAYCWHDVPGLQKFGTYIGNGQNNNFVELGFRPSLVWVKRVVANSSPDTSTNNTSWTIMDDKRLSYNGLTVNHMWVNQAQSEGYRGDGSGTSNLNDMLLEPHSNGFFMNNYGSEVNSNTSKYIYCAWAEQPSFNLYGAQSNAR